mgnify:CR=1 FL=1
MIATLEKEDPALFQRYREHLLESAAFSRFINQSLQARRRCVKIIHGKGRGSDGRQPVLKQKTNQWLRQREEVLAFGGNLHMGMLRSFVWRWEARDFERLYIAGGSAYDDDRPEESPPVAPIDQLIEDGLLSEERLLAAYVEERLGKGFGPLRIRAELRERGVEETLIGRHLEKDEATWMGRLEAAHRRKFGTRPPGDRSDLARRAYSTNNDSWARFKASRRLYDFGATDAAREGASAAVRGGEWAYLEARQRRRRGGERERLAPVPERERACRAPREDEQQSRHERAELPAAALPAGGEGPRDVLRPPRADALGLPVPPHRSRLRPRSDARDHPGGHAGRRRPSGGRFPSGCRGADRQCFPAVRQTFPQGSAAVAHRWTAGASGFRHPFRRRRFSPAW